MSSDLVKRLIEAEIGEAFQAEDGSPELQRTALGQEAATRIEALEAEVADLNKRYEDTHARWDKALARAERLREALKDIAHFGHGSQFAVTRARKALEDDKQ